MLAVAVLSVRSSSSQYIGQRWMAAQIRATVSFSIELLEALALAAPRSSPWINLVSHPRMIQASSQINPTTSNVQEDRVESWGHHRTCVELPNLNPARNHSEEWALFATV